MIRTIRHAFKLTVLLMAFVAISPAQITINEISSGTPDFIEIRNCGGTPIDVSGWTMSTWYSLTAALPTAEPTFTLPAGTMIPANGFLVLQENGTAGTPGTLTNSISVGFNYFWVANRTLEAALTDNTGQGVDYMFRDVFGTGGAPNLPVATTWTGALTSGVGDNMSRVMDFDTNDASDWTTSALASTPDALNPGQNLGGCGGTPPYEANDPAARLDIDGVLTSTFGPAITRTSTTRGASTLTLQSSVNSTQFEMAISPLPLIPVTDPNALTTASGQIANIDLTSAQTIYLVGGLTPTFGPFPSAGITVSLPPSTVSSTSAQAAMTDPSNPDGIALTQGVTFDVLRGASCTGNGTPLTMTNDSAIVRNLGFSYSFYGTSYTQVFVGSNGHVSFNAGESVWINTAAAFNIGNPKIAPFSSDLDPSIAGQVTFFTDNSSFFEVCWQDVPSVNQANSNTVVLLAANGGITFDYDGVLEQRTAMVGLSGGNGTGALTSLDYTAIGTAGQFLNATDTPYELFANSNDLPGYLIAWTMDSAGNPTSVIVQ